MCVSDTKQFDTGDIWLGDMLTDALMPNRGPLGVSRYLLLTILYILRYGLGSR